MKILAIQSVRDKEMRDTNKQSAVDIWRIWRPMRELAKNTDWQIDFKTTFIDEIEKYKDQSEFTNEEIEKSAKKIGEYDIVFHSYYPDPMFFAFSAVISKRYGTKFILDVDDDMFAIDPSNPIWNLLNHDDVLNMQIMIRNAHYITTTNENLADKIRKRTEVNGKVTVIKNYIHDDYKSSKKKHDGIVIGYMGGSSHYNDLHESGVLEAIQKIMFKHKDVKFKCAGVPVNYYLPKGRKEVIDSQRGLKYVSDLYPKLNFDIAVAPILDTIFNRCKSNIKWQEYTRMGAAVVASDVGPYKGLPIDLVPNTSEDWYNALERLVTDEKHRRAQVKKSEELLKTYRLEDNWIEYKTLFEEVVNG